MVIQTIGTGERTYRGWRERQELIPENDPPPGSSRWRGFAEVRTTKASLGTRGQGGLPEETTLKSQVDYVNGSWPGKRVAVRGNRCKDQCVSFLG